MGVRLEIRPKFEKLFYSRYQVADLLGVSFVTVDRLAKAGKLPCRHLGRRVLFTPDDLRTFADSVDITLSIENRDTAEIVDAN